MSRLTQSIIITAIIGILIGFAIGRVSFTVDETFHTSESPDIDDTNELDSIAPNVSADQFVQLAADGNIVNVKDQEAGSEVFISRVELLQDGWVAIAEQESGIVKKVLGAKWFMAGIHQGTIRLLRNTVVGQNYNVVIYSDNGNDEFDFNVDPIIVDSMGNLITMSFETY